MKFSIITVSLNSEKTIEKTINSVITQKYSNIEYIVIDGMSKDNTLDIIKKYKGSIDLLICEEDKGIYDAMNKGLKKATGDIIYFLNSGDYLFDDKIINSINDLFLQDPLLGIVYGDIIEYDDTKTKYNCMMRKNPFEIMAKCGICHQSIFAKKNVFEPNNFFNTKYRIYADYDWLINSILHLKKKIKYLDIPIAYYRCGGQSQQNVSKFFIERINIINNNIRYLDLKSLILKDLRPLLNFIVFYTLLCLKYIFYKIKCLNNGNVTDVI